MSYRLNSCLLPPRREGDSNPRCLVSTHAFQAWTLNHSDISPKETIKRAGDAIPGDSVFRVRVLRARKPASSPAGGTLPPVPSVGRRGLGSNPPNQVRSVCRLPVAFPPSVTLHVSGERGIRTPGTREGSTVFETARFNRSRISPNKKQPFQVT